MNSSDECDLFDNSDEEMLVDVTPNNNPINDTLIKQLDDVGDCIETANNQINDVQTTIDNVITKIHKKCTVLNYTSSDSDPDVRIIFFCNY